MKRPWWPFNGFGGAIQLNANRKGLDGVDLHDNPHRLAVTFYYTGNGEDSSSEEELTLTKATTRSGKGLRE